MQRVKTSFGSLVNIIVFYFKGLLFWVRKINFFKFRKYNDDKGGLDLFNADIDQRME
jgi:hypothetical protein